MVSLALRTISRPVEAGLYPIWLQLGLNSDITWNMAPYAFRDAVRYIIKKTDVNMTNMAGAVRKGASFGYHVGTAAANAVCMACTRQFLANHRSGS